MTQPDPYLRLAEAPSLVIHYPTCSTCDVDLDFDDGWICPSCGTAWDATASDGDKGDLYPWWSGVHLTGPVLSEDEAYAESSQRQRAAREQFLADLGIRSRP